LTYSNDDPEIFKHILEWLGGKRKLDTSFRSRTATPELFASVYEAADKYFMEDLKAEIMFCMGYLLNQCSEEDPYFEKYLKICQLLTPKFAESDVGFAKLKEKYFPTLLPKLKNKDWTYLCELVRDEPRFSAVMFDPVTDRMLAVQNKLNRAEYELERMEANQSDDWSALTRARDDVADLETEIEKDDEIAKKVDKIYKKNKKIEKLWKKFDGMKKTADLFELFKQLKNGEMRVDDLELDESEDEKNEEEEEEDLAEDSDGY
jgi:hypothetical protein